MGSPINLIFGRSTPLGPGLQSWESADFPSVLSFLASPSKHSFQCSTKFSRQFIGNTLMAIGTVFLSMALQSGTWSGAFYMSCFRLSFQAPIFHALFTCRITHSPSQLRPKVPLSPTPEDRNSVTSSHSSWPLTVSRPLSQFAYPTTICVIV